MDELEINKQQAIILLKNNALKIQVKIKKLMREKRVTQQGLAEMIGSDKSYINYIINNRYANPSLKTLSKIELALETTLTELVK